MKILKKAEIEKQINGFQEATDTLISHLSKIDLSTRQKDKLLKPIYQILHTLDVLVFQRDCLESQLDVAIKALKTIDKKFAKGELILAKNNPQPK